MSWSSKRRNKKEEEKGEDKTKKKIVSLIIVLVVSLLLGMSKPVNANPGCVVITVLFADNCPVEGAHVMVKNNTHSYGFPVTNASGQTERCGTIPPGEYIAKAYYPDTVTLFGSSLLLVDENGTGSTTIHGSYNETIPPVIEILTPQNTTYLTSSVPLTFTIDTCPPASWIGYSLDNQANVTITGNTTLTGLANGPHNIIVYANDTYGNMGSSNKTYFTIEQAQPVGGIWIPIDKLGLLAPYISLASTIILATVATAIYVKWKKD